MRQVMVGRAVPVLLIAMSRGADVVECDAPDRPGGHNGGIGLTDIGQVTGRWNQAGFVAPG